MRKWAIGILISCGMLALQPTAIAQPIQGDSGIWGKMNALHETNGGVRMEWRMVWCNGRTEGDRYPVDTRRKWRVGSIGKVIVATGIMKLVNDGKLQLDDEVAHILPELQLQNPWAATDPVRVVHLLEHSSGLDDMHFNEYYATEAGPISLEAALAKNTHSKRIRWRPGTCSAYSNVGYAIAARVIERVTGEQAGEWLRREILLPIGMHNSAFEVDASMFAADSTMVLPVKGKEVMPFRQYLYYPAVGFVSTADDLSRMMVFLMNYGEIEGKRILDSATVARMFRHESTPAAAAEWHEGQRGLGFHLWGTVDDPAVCASGFLDGYIAELCFRPQQCFGWLMLSNDPGRDGSFKARATTELGHTMPGRKRLPPQSTSEDAYPSPAHGHYQFRSPRNGLFAFHDDIYAGLELANPSGQPDGWWYTLVSGDAVRLSVIGHPRWQYDNYQAGPALAGKTADGRDFLLIRDRYYEYDPSPWPEILRTAVFSYQLLVYAGLGMLIWTLIGRLRRRDFAKQALPTSLLANLPFWCGTLGLWLLRSDNAYDLGRMSLLSLGLLGLSIALPLASLVALPVWWRWRAVGLGIAWKWLHLPLLLGNVALAIYLAAYGMLPFLSCTY